MGRMVIVTSFLGGVDLIREYSEPRFRLVTWYRPHSATSLLVPAHFQPAQHIPLAEIPQTSHPTRKAFKSRYPSPFHREGPAVCRPPHLRRPTPRMALLRLY